ncbi:MAG: bacteriohemerythrin [Acetatifactor sp.]|nr:bacteriohemerythrin [Acetatifactor sp.]
MGEIKLWKEEYKIGNEKIDAQHKELFFKVEDLLDMAMTGDEETNRQECLELLDFLISYTIFHFDTEEELQKELNYVSYSQHARMHSEFKNTVRAYQAEVEKDFSKEILKKLTGTLMTWLVMHVCDCDKKIMNNQPISPEMNFDGAEDLIRKVTVQLLACTYDLHIQRTRTSVYKGNIEGKIIVRNIISMEKDHIFLFGFSGDMARALYRKISGMEIQNINELNDIEQSALIELGDIMSTQAMAYLDEAKSSSIESRGDIYLDEYSDSLIDINNSVLLEFETDCGRLEILYCSAG